jgi:hypothetical protein
MGYDGWSWGLAVHDVYYWDCACWDWSFPIVLLRGLVSNCCLLLFLWGLGLAEVGLLGAFACISEVGKL